MPLDSLEPSTARATVADLQTPCLLLDEAKMMRNINRLKDRMAAFGVSLRPHLKTTKSLEVARRAMTTPQGPATVSTLKEAEQFAAGGVTDILYAVGITPQKLDWVLELRRKGVDLTIVLDNPDQARAVAAKARESGDPLPTLIEIDCDGHRSGVQPGDAVLVEIGRILVEGGVDLRGIMTHAGDSYNRPGADVITAAAEQERAAAVACAEQLRAAGLPAPVVSIGSTPTAHFVKDLTGVTEMRAGVYVFFDLFQAGIGVCTLDDIAISVLATVIGHQKEKGWILIDAGWMAMSRDRGTANQEVDQYYGVVCDEQGRPFGDVVMTQGNQEHGVIAVRPGSDAVIPELPVGARVRILPNHACATGAQHDRYHVLDRDNRVQAVWPRFSGW